MFLIPENHFNFPSQYKEKISNVEFKTGQSYWFMEASEWEGPVGFVPHKSKDTH